ncbi:MAG: hypothetical protein RLQ73_22850 [Hoeflea sp. D1-CHI-28]
MVWNDHDEFLTAITGQQTAVVGKDVLDRHGQALQAFIAGLMAIGVVESLEVIDVDHQKRQVGPVPPGGGKAFVKNDVELAAVGKPGQGIGVGFGGKGLIGNPQQIVLGSNLLEKPGGDLFRLDLAKPVVDHLQDEGSEKEEIDHEGGKQNIGAGEERGKRDLSHHQDNIDERGARHHVSAPRCALQDRAHDRQGDHLGTGRGVVDQDRPAQAPRQTGDQRPDDEGANPARIKRARLVFVETALDNDAHRHVGNGDRGGGGRSNQVAGKPCAQGGETDCKRRHHMRPRVEEFGERLVEFLLRRDFPADDRERIPEFGNTHVGLCLLGLDIAPDPGGAGA